MDDRFTKLKNATEQRARFISYQLQGIESSLLGAFISVIASAFISNALGLLKYWLPASFILIWIVLINSLVRSYIPLFKKQKREEARKATKVIKEAKTTDFLSKTNLFILTTKIKNSMPFLKTIGVLFIISFLSITAHELGFVEIDTDFPIVIPLITSLLFLSLPILGNRAVAQLDREDLKIEMKRIGCLGLLITFGYALCFTAALLVLPIWSLVVMYPIYLFTVDTLLSILLVISLQVITALIFINYFSASSVRKEMNVALFNLSRILNRINELPENQPVDDETYQGLQGDYTKAKRYEMSADDTLLVNFYSLVPNSTYLSSINQAQ